MSAAVVLAAGLLGGAGVVARLLLDGAISRRARGPFPVGILAVNLSGTFLLGMLFGAVADADARLIVGAGLLGAYTTFSTWVFDSHRLGGEGRVGLGALNIAASLVLGLGAVWLGRQAGMAW